MPSLKTAIAAGTTVLALGGLTAVAVSAGSPDKVTTSAPAATAPTEVRTEVVEQVIHRTRRLPGSGDGATAPGGPAPLRVSAPAAVSRAGGGRTDVGPAHDAGDDHGRNRGSGSDDGPSHDAGDDHGRNRGSGSDDGPSHDGGDDSRGHGGGDD